MTFEKAAEIGTKKVIRDHSTLGIVVLLMVCTYR